MDKSININLQTHLCNLRTIGKIEEGQSLDTTSKLSVYVPSVWNWILRKLGSDNKIEVIRILREIYNSVSQMSDQLINEINSLNNLNKINKLIDTAITIAECLKSSIHGINNMIRTTYRNFPDTISSLESIVIDIAIVNYKQLLSNIPEKEIPKWLKENICLSNTIVFHWKYFEEYHYGINLLEVKSEKTMTNNTPPSDRPIFSYNEDEQ